MLSPSDCDLVARRLGVIVRKRREELGLSQEQLGHRTGLSQRQIWEIERAKTSPQLMTWLRLADGLEERLGVLILRAERADAE